MCSGFIAAATDTGETGLKRQTADGLYYAVRFINYLERQFTVTEANQVR